VDISKGEQTLKQLVKNANYIRVLPEENKLYFSYEKRITVEGEKTTAYISGFVPIKIELCIRSKQKISLKSFNIHYGNCDTLKTLLAHNVTELYFYYYPFSSCDYWDDIGITGELLHVKGCRRNKKGVINRTFEVSLSGLTRKKGKSPYLAKITYI
jgi:hypothetical protein